MELARRERPWAAAGTEGLPEGDLRAAVQTLGFSEAPSVLGSCLSVYQPVKLTPKPELPEVKAAGYIIHAVWVHAAYNQATLPGTRGDGRHR